MIDGLWVGKWATNISNGIRPGTVVLVFRQGKIFGGNDRVYYIGNFASESDRFHGNLQVSYYAAEPLGIFGLLASDQAEAISITGHLSGDEIKLEGILKSIRKVKVHGLLERKAGCEIF